MAAQGRERVHPLERPRLAGLYSVSVFSEVVDCFGLVSHPGQFCSSLEELVNEVSGLSRWVESVECGKRYDLYGTLKRRVA